MKKIIPFLSLFCIISVLVSGCGGEFTGNSQRGTVSGGAVSGEAVSGGVVSGDAVDRKSTRLNSSH